MPLATREQAADYYAQEHGGDDAHGGMGGDVLLRLVDKVGDLLDEVAEELDATAYLALQHGQLMPERGILASSRLLDLIIIRLPRASRATTDNLANPQSTDL